MAQQPNLSVEWRTGLGNRHLVCPFEPQTGYTDPARSKAADWLQALPCNPFLRAEGKSCIMEVYKRQTREIIMRFLLRQLSFQKCIAALDAALAGALPRQKPEQLDELRAVMLANNEKVMEEMARRGSPKR